MNLNSDNPDPIPPVPRRSTLGTILLFAGSAAAGLLLGACSPDSSSPGRGRLANAPVPVIVATAGARDVPVEIRAIGTVQAYSMVNIRSQITGPIQEVHFQEGQNVKAGDPLFTIDPRPWQAALNLAEANLKRDEAQTVSARLEFLRTSNLFAGKIASQQDYDTAEAAFGALEATVLADGAAVSNAQVSLSYTAIRSPIDGRTGSLTVKAGNVVKSPDDTILTIAQVQPVYVAFAVPEQHLPVIRRESAAAELPLRAVIPSEPDRIERGVLTFINNTVDTNTGTILLKGTFANEHRTLWPGQFVEVMLTVSNLVQATVVPTQAVQTGQEGEFIFIVRPDDTVTNMPVATSVSSSGFTVITSGVKPGDTVVIDGQLRLTPGAKIAITSSKPGEAPPPAASADQP
jgi:multidrug efflux system membrane fusion protein